MKKLLVLLAFALPLPAMATCTWSTNFDAKGGTAVCTTVAESAFVFATSSAVGWPSNLCPKGFTVIVCNDGTNAITAALTLSLYLYDGTVGGWAKYPDQDITSATIAANVKCQAFDGKWAVVPATRVALIPTAGTTAGGDTTIHYRCN
jgi:hypothetical protein